MPASPLSSPGVGTPPGVPQYELPWLTTFRTSPAWCRRARRIACDWGRRQDGDDLCDAQLAVAEAEIAQYRPLGERADRRRKRPGAQCRPIAQCRAPIAQAGTGQQSSRGARAPSGEVIPGDRACRGQPRRGAGAGVLPGRGETGQRPGNAPWPAANPGGLVMSCGTHRPPVR